MNKQEVLEKIKELGLLAVIRGPSAELTVQMVEALIKGGVLGIEITYSTPDAENVVKTLSSKFGSKIVLGMGTLTKPDQAESAKAAGANFLVSPICEPALVKAMVATGLLTMAGALTPTEVFQAYIARHGRGQGLPRVAGRTLLHQGAERPLPIYPDDAHRRGQRCQRGRLVQGWRGGGGCRQRTLPARSRQSWEIRRDHPESRRLCGSH